MNEAPSNTERDQQQDVDASSVHRHESLDGTASEDEGAVGGMEVQVGGGLDQADLEQAFPPLPQPAGRIGSPAAPSSPYAHTRKAAPTSHSQASRKNPDRKAKGK